MISSRLHIALFLTVFGYPGAALGQYTEVFENSDFVDLRPLYEYADSASPRPRFFLASIGYLGYIANYRFRDLPTGEDVAFVRVANSIYLRRYQFAIKAMVYRPVAGTSSGRAGIKSKLHYQASRYFGGSETRVSRRLRLSFGVETGKEAPSQQTIIGSMDFGFSHRVALAERPFTLSASAVAMYTGHEVHLGITEEFDELLVGRAGRVALGFEGYYVIRSAHHRAGTLPVLFKPRVIYDSPAFAGTSRARVIVGFSQFSASPGRSEAAVFLSLPLGAALVRKQ